ncbi:hypothetical protein HNQ75_003560 [Rhizobium flavum]|uniref:Uncharacterized protein n=1 Tax=Pseudorhizobium flavum TaxID=1335061 RepID=A0A7W9Z034_9HYPH|nr:hypothetical protein [Pseudorhizobium flavum]
MVEHGDIVHQERRVVRVVTPLRSTP